MSTLYSPKQFYKRVKIFLKEYRPRRTKGITQLQFWHLRAFVRSIWFLGVKERGRRQYWRFFVSTLFRHPRSFPMSMALAVYGFHFRTVARNHIGSPVRDVPA
jgi:hypothetical protein